MYVRRNLYKQGAGEVSLSPAPNHGACGLWLGNEEKKKGEGKKERDGVIMRDRVST